MSTDQISPGGWDPELYQVIAQTLECVKALESDCGSQGFVDFLSKRTAAKTSHQAPKALKFPKSVLYTCTFSSSPIHGVVVDIITEDGYTAQYKRAVWSPLNATVTGSLNFNSWEGMTSAPNVMLYTGASVASMRIKDEGEVVIDPECMAKKFPGYPADINIQVMLAWKAPENV